VHVIFDLDGVLLDSETDLAWLHDALEETLRAFDVPVTDSNVTSVGPSRVRDFGTVAREFGVDPERLWTVRHRNYLEAKLAAIEAGDVGPFDDVVRLRDLRPPHDLHIISNSPGEVVEAFVDRYGFADLFDVRVGRGSNLEDLDRLKPDRHLFERFCARVEAIEGDGGGYVYVGDSVSDWKFARNVDVPYLHVMRGEPYDEHLDDDGVPTFEGLDGVVEWVRSRP
jgi:phosphoglycolate phosphatase